MIISNCIFIYVQAFYTSGKGESVIDHKSDIWSGSVTMMNVLIGKGAKWGPFSQVCALCIVLLRM